MDEGSTMRIYELGKRGELAEEGAAHIVQESLAMRKRYHAELESASQHIREQHEQSEVMAEHFRQNGLQLGEACTQYVNDRANKEDMELLTQKLEESSQSRNAIGHQRAFGEPGDEGRHHRHQGQHSSRTLQENP